MHLVLWMLLHLFCRLHRECDALCISSWSPGLLPGCTAKRMALSALEGTARHRYACRLAGRWDLYVSPLASSVWHNHFSGTWAAREVWHFSEVCWCLAFTLFLCFPDFHTEMSYCS